MPPKKPVVEEKIKLGRPSNNVKAGLVGLPNVGKSSTFNVMCGMSVPAENFPFCTIDPSVSKVEYPDERFEFLCEKWQPTNRVPAHLTITDIAGLVKGAHEGEGLGNAFLSHILAVDALFHIVRCFDDPDVTHTEGNVDPIRDLEIIQRELQLKDVAILEKELEGAKKNCRANNDKGKARDMQLRLDMLEKALAVVKDEQKDIRFTKWNGKEVDWLNEIPLLTAKPAMYLCNMSEKDFLRKKNKWLPKVKAWVDEHKESEPMVPYSAQFETNLLELEDEEKKKAFCEENKVQSMMPKIVRTGYDVLDLQHFYTAGTPEVRCWTIRKGWKAPQAAGTIHTDFERGFIMAETMSFDDFKELGSEAEVKAKGKLRQEGKGYVVKPGDIIHFKFNVTDSKKK